MENLPNRLETSRLTGLGDVVERVTSVTGIKAATEKISQKLGRECGCAKRREALNKLVPFGQGRHRDG